MVQLLSGGAGCIWGGGAAELGAIAIRSTHHLTVQQGSGGPAGATRAAVWVTGGGLRGGINDNKV